MAQTDEPLASEPTRWSRSLSANRRRELDRLNQIERRRQMLELRRQDDLFDRMSFAVSAQVGAESEPTASGQTPGRQASPRVSQASDRLESNSPEELLDKQDASSSGASRSTLDARGASSSPMSETRTPQRRQVDSRSERGRTVPVAEPKQVSLTAGQLIEFVESCVPRNKRVLCLIVRDKVSRFNQAKSYFYPTYYLFIQAIVDIDDGYTHAGQSAALGGPEAIGQQVSGRASGAGVPAVDDNSFSASSSISADMMFIGALAADTSPTDGPSASAGRGAASAVGVVASNSYSDNEALADESERDGDADDDPEQDGDDNHAEPGVGRPKRRPRARIPSQTPDSAERQEARAGYARNFRAAMRHRESPSSVASSLVHPTPHAPASAAVAGKSPPPGGVARRLAGGVSPVSAEGTPQPPERELVLASLFDNERNPYTGTYGVLLASRKRKKAKTYLIGPNEQGFTKKNCITKLKSNVLGTQFNAIRVGLPNDDRRTIASVSYETNVLGFKGPRKMRVLLSKGANSHALSAPATKWSQAPASGEPDQSGCAADARSLAELRKRDPSAVIQLRNMTPSWNVDSQSYVLNFHGRVTQASVKNFQLVESADDLQLQHQQRAFDSQQVSSRGGAPALELQRQHPAEQLLAGPSGPEGSSQQQHQQLQLQLQQQKHHEELLAAFGNQGLAYDASIVMQFGRISSHEFTCDVTYPLSILQAFSIALSSFDSKLACE